MYMPLHVNDKAALHSYCKAGIKDLSMRKLRIVLIFFEERRFVFLKISDPAIFLVFVDRD